MIDIPHDRRLPQWLRNEAQEVSIEAELLHLSGADQSAEGRPAILEKRARRLAEIAVGYVVKDVKGLHPYEMAGLVRPLHNAERDASGRRPPTVTANLQSPYGSESPCLGGGISHHEIWPWLLGFVLAISLSAYAVSGR